MLFNFDALTAGDQALYLELGPDEVASRVDQLGTYERYAVIAQVTDYDRTFTPAQAIAWAKFAETLGREALVDGMSIKTPKDEQSKIVAVLRNVRSARERAERKAEKEAADATS